MERKEIKKNIARLKKEIVGSAKKSGRSSLEVRILAATKTRNVAEIKAALDEGIDLIGENTVQDALDKFEFLPPDVERHFIGHLQLNKAREAVMLFDLIQSVDTLKLARELSQRSKELRKRPPILIEVNTSDDPKRWGIKPEDLLQVVEEASKLDGIKIQGLMAMPPYCQDPEKLRPQFRKVKELADELTDVDRVEMKYLSMGISNDFKVAIEEGSNLIRIGSYIFGSRDYG